MVALYKELWAMQNNFAQVECSDTYNKLLAAPQQEAVDHFIQAAYHHSSYLRTGVTELYFSLGATWLESSSAEVIHHKSAICSQCTNVSL